MLLVPGERLVIWQDSNSIILLSMHLFRLGNLLLLFVLLLFLLSLLSCQSQATLFIGSIDQVHELSEFDNYLFRNLRRIL